MCVSIRKHLHTDQSGTDPSCDMSSVSADNTRYWMHTYQLSTVLIDWLNPVFNY